MNITISNVKKTEVYILPVVPPGIPIKTGSKNETFSAVSQELNIIGNSTLTEISIDSFLPVNKNYDFQKAGSEEDGKVILDFILQQKTLKLPIRVVMTDKSKGTVLNMLMSIESLDYNFDKLGDIRYSMALREFPQI